MHIDSPFQPMKFSDVPEGAFFKAMRDTETFFGLKVKRKDNSTLAAMIFNRTGSQPGAPWVAHGDFSDAIAVIPNAALRPDLKTTTASDGNFAFGVLIASPLGYLMKASDGMGRTAIFNVETGQESILPEQRPLIIYPKWLVGYAADQVFAPLFSFPLPTSGSSPLNL